MVDAVEMVIDGPKNVANLSSCWRMFRWWPALLLLPLALVACSSSLGGLSVGNGGQGEALIIVVEEIKRLQEIRYQGIDQKHYLVAPSSKDNELLAIRLNVHNKEATTILMTVDEDAVELNGYEAGENYKLLDVTPQNQEIVRAVEESHPSENRYVPFIAGKVLGGLPKGHSLIGWVVFEVPKGTSIREMRWGEGDTVYIRS